MSNVFSKFKFFKMTDFLHFEKHFLKFYCLTIQFLILLVQFTYKKMARAFSANFKPQNLENRSIPSRNSTNNPSQSFKMHSIPPPHLKNSQKNVTIIIFNFVMEFNVFGLYCYWIEGIKKCIYIYVHDRRCRLL